VDVRGERIAAARVISTVPWFDLPNLVRSADGPGADGPGPDGKAAAEADPASAQAAAGAGRPSGGGSPVASLAPLMATCAAMQPSPIVTVNVWLDRSVMDTMFVGLPGRVMQWVFDKAAICREDQQGHLSLISSGASTVLRESNDALVERAITELRQALPRARDARLLRATVVREPQSTISLALDQPARPGMTTPVEGLWLAGDWVDTGLPATIESAVVSGHRAANAVCDTLFRLRA
jgi:hypothetical protein